MDSAVNIGMARELPCFADLRMEILANARAAYDRSPAARNIPNPRLEILVLNVLMPTLQPQDAANPTAATPLPIFTTWRPYYAVVHVNHRPFVQGAASATRTIAYESLADAMAEWMGLHQNSFMLRTTMSHHLGETNGTFVPIPNDNLNIVNIAAPRYNQDASHNTGTFPAQHFGDQQQHGAQQQDGAPQQPPDQRQLQHSATRMQSNAASPGHQSHGEILPPPTTTQQSRLYQNLGLPSGVTF